MRILFVNEKRGPFGGVEQCVADSARALSERGHDCHLAYGMATPRASPDFDARFASLTRCAELGPQTGGADAPLVGLVDRLQPDVVYAHNVARIAPVVEAARRTRLVRMLHDHDVVCPRRHKYDAFAGRTCQRAAGWGCVMDLAFVRRALDSPLGVAPVNLFAWFGELARHRALPVLFVASTYMRQELVRNGCDPAHVRLVVPCVDLRAAFASPPPAGPRLLFVGQLIRGKGVDLLLQALARLPRDYTLDVVGTGNAHGALAALAERLELTQRVTFHGWVDRPALGELLRGARMLVVPSRWPEPFGMVGVEAMAHARAVVAFDVGGIADWLVAGSTGLLVPEQDVDGLAAAVARVHETPGLAEELGRAGRTRYERAYGFEKLGRNLERELTRAVGVAQE